MAKRKKAQKRVSNTFVVVTAPEGKKDEKGQKALSEARRGIEKDGYRVVKSAVVEDEHGRTHTVFAGKLPSENNLLLIGEKPL